MATNPSNEVVLSYYDSLLRVRDVALLQGPHWLNDVIIGFYFEYLDKKFNRKDGKKELLFVSPELTQLLKLTDPSEYNIFLDPLNITESKCIFFPLNNCEKTDAAGGSHWSLLVFCRESRTCYHFDSSRGYNKRVAMKFSNDIMNCILGVDITHKKFIDMDCPQQDNGYDCGIFVLCLADLIIDHIMKTGEIHGCDCSRVKEFTYSKRIELLNVINNLKHKSS